MIERTRYGAPPRVPKSNQERVTEWRAKYDRLPRERKVEPIIKEKKNDPQV